jgi:magnesium and cobalt exporter, CNNM family
MQATGFNIVGIVILLAANGFFVAAEFSLVRARGIRLETYAVNGSAGARLGLHIQSELESYLAACQLGITMASLGLGWLGQPVVATFLEPFFRDSGLPQSILHITSFVAGFLIFTSLYSVLGTQVPRTLAIRRAESISVWVAYPLHFVYLLMYPFNWLLRALSNTVLSLFRVNERSHKEGYSGEEIKLLPGMSHKHRETEADTAVMLRNLVGFEQCRVGRVMIPASDMKVLHISGTPQDNLKIMRDSGHSRFPVIESPGNDSIVGVLCIKDLYIAMLNGDEQPWTDLRKFCRIPLLVPESQSIACLFEHMREYRTHMAFIVDVYGELAGIVTLEDLIEEIVGDIRYETDPDEVPAIVELDRGHWLADGLASLVDVERTTGMKIPDEVDARTLSDLFLCRLSRMPRTGDWIEEDDFRLIVRSLEDNQVGQVGIDRIFDASDFEPLDNV